MGRKYLYDDGLWLENLAYTPPKKPVPEKIEKAQAVKAMLTQGITEAMVDSAIDQIEGDLARGFARADWRHSNIVRRDSGLVNSLAPAFNLSQSDLDDLFRMGVQL